MKKINLILSLILISFLSYGQKSLPDSCLQALKANTRHPSNVNPFVTKNELNESFDSTKFIPRAGTTNSAPLTGTIEYRGAIYSTAFVDTVGAFYIGAGDSKDIDNMYLGGAAYFDNKGAAGMFAYSNGLSRYPNGQSYLNLLGSSVSINSRLNSSYSTLTLDTGNISIMGGNWFKGLQYDIFTESHVSANKNGYSILDMNQNDARYQALTGTTNSNPLTGTIEYRGAANSTAFVDTVGSYYIGYGNKKNISTATINGNINFNSNGGVQLNSVSSSTVSYVSASPTFGLNFVASVGNNNTQFIMNSGNMVFYSTNSTFKGLQYSSITESYVTTNNNGLSILDRNQNDNRYLFKTGTITINGSTQTFSSNPSFTVSSGTTYTTSTPLTITSSTVIGLNYSSPLTVTGNSLTIPTSNGSTNGYLSSTDWTTFNNKASSSATFTVNGVAMALGTSSTTIAAGTGLTLSTNTLSINTTQNTVTTATALASVGTVTTGTWNSRIQPTYSTVTTASLITINTDNYSAYSVTSLSTATTFTTPTGTPTPFQSFILKVKDNGSSQTLSFVTTAGGFNFSQFQPAPTATTAGKWLYLYMIWNAQSGYWDTTWKDGF